MCSFSSIIMPADYEMLVSHSPPVFNSYLSDYSSLHFNRNNIARFSRATCRSASTNSFLLPPTKNINYTPSAPRRPCLVIRPDDTTSSSSDEDPTSPTRLKKKVVFADDRGMSLTHVRIMTEPSNVPPILNSRFLSEVTRGLSANPVSNIGWEITFAQPASDYLEFRRKLDSEKVSLENVIIKESEGSATGTVKVSNISFEKEILVRCSIDSWKTHEDIYCIYVNNGSSNTVSAAYVLYDTFSFKIALPTKSKRIEFCVCYRCGGKEYWDNNNNNNYVLIKKTYHESLNNDLIKAIMQNQEIPKAVIKCKDAINAKVESWSEFASWNHLENTSPYW